MSEERLQRILARAGIASRRNAEEMIREGRVTVNGQVALIGGKADPEIDAIKLDGKRVQPHTGGFHYLLLNKPKAVMSTVTDPEERPTVMDYVPSTMRKALVPVGRLDFNTEGLIILTDDGDFAQHVAHPRYGGVKVYDVKVKGRPAEAQIQKLREGIPLDGRRTSPCRITPRYGDGGVEKRRSRARARDADEKEGENSWWTVELAEGRTRQIREMFFRIGHGVLKLRRIAIGPLRDANLPLGSIRELTETEVEKLRRATARLKKPAPAAKKAPAAKPAVKRAFPPPGTQKVDRSRPWREEKPKGEIKAAPATDRNTDRSEELPSRQGTAKPARPASRKPAKKTYGPPARKASGKPSRKPARKASGKASAKTSPRPSAKASGKSSGRPGGKGKPSSRPGGRPSGSKGGRKPGGGASRAGRRGR